MNKKDKRERSDLKLRLAYCNGQVDTYNLMIEALEGRKRAAITERGIVASRIDNIDARNTKT